MRLHDAWHIRLEAEREAKIKSLEEEIARLRDALDEQTGRAAWHYECLTKCEETVIQRDAEIERLRPTDAEVAAIRLGELACPGLRITDRGKWVDVWATLRGLRDRTSGTHATPAQGSVQGQ